MENLKILIAAVIVGCVSFFAGFRVGSAGGGKESLLIPTTSTVTTTPVIVQPLLKETPNVVVVSPDVREAPRRSYAAEQTVFNRLMDAYTKEIEEKSIHIDKFDRAADYFHQQTQNGSGQETLEESLLWEVKYRDALYMLGNEQRELLSTYINALMSARDYINYLEKSLDHE